MPQSLVTVQYEADVAVLTMNSPDGRQHLTDQLLVDLSNALDDVIRNKDAKALVTTGTGRFYCNGFDMAAIESVGWEGMSVTRDRFYSLAARLITFPLPTVAAINGHAFAGGCLLALVHDFRVMQTGRGWMSLSEVRRGLRFHPTSMAIIRSKVPPGPAQTELVLWGRRLTAQDAARVGLVQETAPPDELLRSVVSSAVAVISQKGAPLGREILQITKQDLFIDVMETSRRTIKSFGIDKSNL